MRGAAIMAESTVVESDDGAKDWSEIGEELLQKSVRVLVFKDSAEDFRNALLRSMQNTQIAGVYCRGASFFVFGAHCQSKGREK